MPPHRRAAGVVLSCIALLAACNRQPERAGDDTVQKAMHESSLASLAGLPPCDDLPEPGPGWTSADAGPFSLRLPAGYRKVPVQGIDSFVGEYRAPRRALHFDYGVYSSTLEEWRSADADFRSCRMEIGGHLAKVVTARAEKGGYLAGATWRELEKGDELGATHLTMAATSADADGQREALAVFGSVRFKTMEWPSR
jgi:hypothetical protein